VPTEMIRTSALLANTPGSASYKRRHIRVLFAGKFIVPTEVPFRHALAVAAAADAQERGTRNPDRVLDLLLKEADLPSGMLVVFFGRVGSPKLVEAASFEPQPATVIDLDQLSRQLRTGDQPPPVANQVSGT
jgi:hypothetical protein